MAGTASHRARRWDVLVLGGALPGLVAGVRLARAGHRVLVAEEEIAVRTPPLLREPFALPGPANAGILDPCLQALGLALIDRRAFETHTPSHQVILPDARIDVGGAAATAEEWVAWGLAKPEEAYELAQALEEAAHAEAQAMLEAPVVDAPRRAIGRRRATPRVATAGAATVASGQRHMRGLPQELEGASDRLRAVLAAEVRAFGSLAAAEPSPEARARLMGAALAGGGAHPTGAAGLRDLIRQRLSALHAEFRTLKTPFEFVRVGDHPGIARRGPGDAWMGRLLIVNAPPTRLAQALRGWGAPVPGFLDGPVPSHRRLAIHLRAMADVMPEPLAPRSILVTDPDEPTGPGTYAVSWHPSPRGTRFRDLVARTVVPDDPSTFEDHAERAEAAIARLMPFSEGRLKRAPLLVEPEWDDEAALADPPPGGGWPGAARLRHGGRDPIFVLPREPLAALGVEGDLLLGWRAGDALAELL